MKDWKLGNRISAALFAATIMTLLAMAGLSLATPDLQLSRQELRNYQQYVAPSRENFLNGKWTSTYETYSLDQFVFRDQALRCYFGLEDLAGVYERSGFLQGTEEGLILKEHPVSWGNMTKQNLADYAKNRMDALQAIKKAGGEAEVLVLHIPHKNTWFAEKYPKYYPFNLQGEERKLNAFMDAAEELNFDFLDATSTMEEHRDEYIYFYTDNHYTFRGAYYVYQMMLKHLNQGYGESLSFPDWDACEYVSGKETRFVGNYLRSFGDAGTSNIDYMEYIVPKFPEYTRYESGVESELPVLDMNEFDWSRLMSGNCGNTKIDTKRPELPNILYIGYSYTNALEFMSIYSFNEMHSLDLRYYTGDALAYIRENHFDYIVVVLTDEWEKVIDLGKKTAADSSAEEFEMPADTLE